ncbi:single-pass membrane protein with aspartate-rich tail 1b [Anguilla anguilla]|nr:single-pass membrane protein with aspartate-rich tail 1b [Anguilla anguilla]
MRRKMAMASAVCSLSRRFVLKNTRVLTHHIKYTGTKVSIRNAVTTSSGAVLPKPVKTSFGLIRMTIVVVPFLYVGTLISKNFAALLEEHDIFVPEDDDDDD